MIFCYLIQGDLIYEITGYLSAPSFFDVDENGDIYLVNSVAMDTTSQYVVWIFYAPESNHRGISCLFICLSGYYFSTFATTFFGLGSLTRVQYRKCAYGPYC